MLIGFVLFNCCADSNKSINVQLNKRTRLDFENVALHPLTNISSKEFNLPVNYPDTISFLKIQQPIFNKHITIYKITQEQNDLIFIDEDGTFNYQDDGPAKIFPHNENEISFTVYALDDIHKFVDIVLLRSAENNAWLDENGNVHEKHLALFKTKYPNFKGDAGSFFFLSAKLLSRGSVKIANATYDVALFETSGNGLFNDYKTEGIFGGDLFLIDLNQDNKLSFFYEGETFYLDEVFSINQKNYMLSKIDPFGRFVEIIETEKEPNKKYLEHVNQQYRHGRREETFEFSETFWDKNYKSLKNVKIDISKFKNKYLLLNFWGEWCRPCLAEIPELKYIFEKYSPDKLEIISFIKIADKEKAYEVIKTEKIYWPQIEYDEHVRKQIRVNTFPTNILIQPDGKAIKVIGTINRIFIENNLK